MKKKKQQTEDMVVRLTHNKEVKPKEEIKPLP